MKNPLSDPAKNDWDPRLAYYRTRPSSLSEKEKFLGPLIFVGFLLVALAVVVLASVWDEKSKAPFNEKAVRIQHVVALNKCRSLGYSDYEWRPCSKYDLCFYCADEGGEVFPVKAPPCALWGRERLWGKERARDFVARCGNVPLPLERNP